MVKSHGGKVRDSNTLQSMLTPFNTYEACFSLLIFAAIVIVYISMS